VLGTDILAREDFQRIFPDDTACAAYLEILRAMGAPHI